MKALLIGFVLVILGSGALLGEVYRDIQPYDTLADLRRKFPAATFKKLNPAWAQANEALYEISGSGLQGSIVVKFDDWVGDREAWRLRWKEEIAKEDANPKLLELLGKFAVGSDDSLAVSWVRWHPDRPVPLRNVIALYGPPSKSGVSEVDFTAYRAWTSRGIHAILTSKGEVESVEFTFTDADMDKDFFQPSHPGWCPIPPSRFQCEVGARPEGLDSEM